MCSFRPAPLSPGSAPTSQSPRGYPSSRHRQTSGGDETFPLPSRRVRRESGGEEEGGSSAIANAPLPVGGATQMPLPVGVTQVDVTVNHFGPLLDDRLKANLKNS